MNFSELSVYLQKLELTASRITITEILAQLYKKVTPVEAAFISYLLQGRVAPVFEPIEFGIGGKLMLRAIAKATESTEAAVFKKYKTLGDLGATAEELKKRSSFAKATVDKQAEPARHWLAPKASAGGSVKRKELIISQVFDYLKEIALNSGTGSQDNKLELLAKLIAATDPLSARYLVRIPLAKLRLGFSDMTIIDALSWMLTNDKSNRKLIEKAYNVRPDLGFIAQTIKEKGVIGLQHIDPVPGIPILMARANRLSSASDILLKLGPSAIEYKYDGLRLQVHYKRKAESGKWKEMIKMFSRNLEDITPMFPDIFEAVGTQIAADEAIFEGEIVAYNPKTGVSVPFQETMQRKRKYNIAQTAKEIPVKLYVFELLYLNGRNYIHEPYTERKKELKRIIRPGATIIFAQEKILSRVSEIQKMFDDSVKLNFEGIIAKKLTGTYEAGVRGWNWIKFKQAMTSELSDTVDVVVMGYTYGQGKRTSFGVGQFLAGVYDPTNDQYLTLTKVGTGLTDSQFKEFITRVKKLKTAQMPTNYVVDKLLEPDVWLKPSLVVELGADQITRSQVHTAGRIMGPSKSGSAQEVKTAGFALRFPRLIRFRDDKRETDATTVSEITAMAAK